MSWWLWFIAGIFVGAFFGASALSIAVAARDIRDVARQVDDPSKPL